MNTAVNLEAGVQSARSFLGRKKPRFTGAFFVSDTGIEPATSSVSGKRATAAPIALTSSCELEVDAGFEPAWTALQAAA
jgi:hypothetical protein